MKKNKFVAEKLIINFMEESINGIVLALINNEMISSPEVLIDRMRKFDNIKKYMLNVIANNGEESEGDF